MRILLQLAAILALTATTAHAQITSSDKLIAPSPRNPADRPIARHGDLQWLWQYTRPAPSGAKAELLADKRLPALLADNFHAPQAMWGTGVSLSAAARTFLDGAGTVSTDDNRRLLITGCVVAQCQQRGLLYADLGLPADPLLVFAALRWNEQGHTPAEHGATFTLWLFPNRAIDAHQLPGALKSSLAHWAGDSSCASSTITNAIVVDPTGVPHILGALDAGLHPSLCSTGPHA